MLALAAALLAPGQIMDLPGMSGHERAAGSAFATRGVPASFEQFDRELLLAVAQPCPRGRVGLTVLDSAEILQRYAACDLAAVRRELLSWVQALNGGSVTQLRRLEAMATASLLQRAEVQCAYRLAPLGLPGARPIVVVQLQVLESVGRERFLRALWESELAVGAGSEQEFGALYDEFAERLKQHIGRMGGERAGNA